MRRDSALRIASAWRLAWQASTERAPAAAISVRACGSMLVRMARAITAATASRMATISADSRP